MSIDVAWILGHARRQTLELTRGIPESDACHQSYADEHHPAWIIGHLLLADSYLLHLLDGRPLPEDFGELIQCFGPGAPPRPEPGSYPPLEALCDRLRGRGVERTALVSRLGAGDLARPVPDPVLVQVQPTIGHHLVTLVYHEGYHGGQLAAWRRSHGLDAAEWTFAPPAA